MRILQSGFQPNLILSILILLLPIGMFMLGYAIFAKNIKPVPGNDADAGLPEYAPESPTVANWLSDFFIAAIPIVGLICLIVWARDNERPVRKSWATAVLLASCIAIVVTIVYYLFKATRY